MSKRVDWEEIYRTNEYQAHWGIPFASQELVAFVAAYPFTSDTVALDIGCGAGQESIFLAQQGFKVTGVDLSSEALNIAAKKAAQAGVEVNWQKGNALHLPVEDQSVDLINDRGCFHVIDNEHRSQYAQEVARVLKPGGKMLLRGCREKDNDSFVAITSEVVQKYFSKHFSFGSILPIQLMTGNPNYTLPANLVILHRL